jgi:DNA sulfur modification protein DndB
MQLVPLFNGRVNHASNSLPASSDNVITVNTLYEGTDHILRGLGYDRDTLWDQTSVEIQKASDAVMVVWKAIIADLPGWDDVMKGNLKPNDLREQYVFAHGIGWQAIALAGATMAQELGSGWLPKFEATLKSITWTKANPDWQNVCMIGDRMNNTGPGIRATAGYILQKGGITGGKAANLIEQYQKSKSLTSEAA